MCVLQLCKWLVTIQQRSATWQGGQGEGRGGGKREEGASDVPPLPSLCLPFSPVHSRSVTLPVCSVSHSVALLLHSSCCLLGHLSLLPSRLLPSSLAVPLLPYYSFFRSTFPSYRLHLPPNLPTSQHNLFFTVRCSSLCIFVSF